MRAVVIGAGHMGRYHADKLAALPGVELAGVVDANRLRASELARRHGCAAFSDFKQILHGKADAAVIAVPTDRHYEVASACLEHGLHVLIEKPIATSIEEADALIGLAERKARVLQVGHVERYSRAFRALAERMDRPVFLEAERLAGFKQRGAEVDVVLDLMIHDLDLAAALARADVLDVSACGFRVLTDDIDIANARIEFANGCVANLSASRVSQAPVRKLRVFQSDLYVSADLQKGSLRYVRRAGGGFEQTEERYEGGDALAAQAKAFVSSITKSTPVEVGGVQGRKILELALDVGRLVRERLKRFA
ncbi:MAG TPA: Gfo/Idh/MocA family oxidoreductase [Burkholderiales bacterium]|nr:Gfo/Idh/MocA family oxidoreductase [Burkholderiales bacterium]